MIERDGRELVYRPFNYTRSYSLDPLRDLLLDPVNIVSLSDGGAHCAEICDASAPTFFLTHWVRDRGRNGTIPLEMAVKRQTRETAQLYGLEDRGALLPGLKADINLIDFDHLNSHAPEIVFDFPARRQAVRAARRRLQIHDRERRGGLYRRPADRRDARQGGPRRPPRAKLIGRVRDRNSGDANRGA